VGYRGKILCDNFLKPCEVTLSGLLLAAAAVLFAALYILNALARTFARSAKIGFWETLLIFLAVLISLAALIANSTDALPSEFVQQVVLIAAGILAILSLPIILLEFRRKQAWNASRGLLGIGAGLMVVLATFVIVPFTTPYFFPPATATTTNTPIGTPPPPTNTPTSTSTSTATRTPTLTMTPTYTRTPRPTPTPTDTRIPAVPSRTPRPTETPINPCVAQVANNLNLRTEPRTDAELLTTIPFDTSLAIFGRNEDSTWWFVAYEGQEGWVLGEFLLVTEPCYDLPIRDN
jgi:hypothetical protein